MVNPIFWIIYLALIFWSFYQKWDEKKDKYLEYPYLTTLYFIFASGVISIFFPHIVNFFQPDKFGILILIGVLISTYLLYKSLKSVNDKKIVWPFKDYFQVLDERYIIPKLFEIVFQQIFFVSIFLISLNTFSETTTLVFTVLAFALAHLNLFLFRSIREAVFYLLFSIVGAPIFVLLIINTEVLWYSIALHLAFYTLLSLGAWTWNVFKSSKTSSGT